MSSGRKTINFAAGPAKVPQEVLLEAQQEFLDYASTGISVCELSHRSATFGKIMDDAEAGIRQVLHVPENYAVFFMHGGGVGQMAAVAMNLSGSSDAVVDYVVTGSWSEKAAKEASKYCRVNVVNPQDGPHFTSVQDQGQWKLSPNASYLYFCDNETIHGVEFPEVPSSKVPIVCDMTSNLFTKEIDVSKYGCIFAGTQKNAGIAALTVVILRKDLIKTPLTITPSILSYEVTLKNKSLQNTPPCFPIYITGLVMKWLQKNGGLKGMRDLSLKKSNLIYECIDSSNGFYVNPVEKKYRSHVTIPFRIGSGNEELEKQFLKEAEQVHGMIQLKGHRSVGGIRASMYNAMTVDEVSILYNFMKEFQTKNQ